MKKTISIIIAILAAAAGSIQYFQNVPSADDEGNMYAEPLLWYDNGRVVNQQLADVFYILPTCIHDWKDSSGKICHYASLTDVQQRGKMEYSYKLANEIFADSANFFAPYYRHITMETWMEGPDTLAKRFPFAMNDIRNAFHYYLKKKNNGRPFILAGFSQGAKCVVELIKEMDEETAAKMIAAYVCGYKVTASDTLSSPYLRKAHKADDTGVTIVYNTVTDIAAQSPVLAEGNVFIINPASWTTDAKEHQLNDTTNIRIDTSHNVLIAHGIDATSIFTPTLEKIFPLGNLHLLELSLYANQLKDNVKLRIKAFSQGNNQ